MSHVAILLGLLLGIALGAVASWTGSPALFAIAEGVAPLGTVFLRALQMVVIPLVAVTVFVGVAKIGDLRKLGRIGGLSIAFFWSTTLLAILIGMGVTGIAVRWAPDVTAPAAGEVAPELPGLVDFLVSLVPSNPFEAATSGALLPILVFTVLFAAATTTIPAGKQAPLLGLGEAASDVLIRLVHWVLWIAPVGVFGLAAPVAARTGLGMLQNLGIFVGAVIVGLLAFAALVLLPAVRIFGGAAPVRFVRGTVGTAAMGFGTTSSVATLPVMFEEAGDLGVSPEVSNLVLPLAASLNRPGSALYQGAAVIFLASVYGVPLSPGTLVGAYLAVFLAAMTVAPVPSASVMTMAPALDTAGVPAAGLGLMLGIDRIPDMFRTVVNVVGHVAAAVVVDARTSAGDRVSAPADTASDREPRPPRSRAV